MVPSLPDWRASGMLNCRSERRIVTIHVLTILVTVAAFFGLLWIAVFMLGISPDQAFILSLLTFALAGLGIMFTTAMFRQKDDDEW
jgi:hypothetical protein